MGSATNKVPTLSPNRTRSIFMATPQIEGGGGISEDEERMLKALVEHTGLSISDVIRQYIRRAFAEAFPPRRTKR